MRWIGRGIAGLILLVALLWLYQTVIPMLPERQDVPAFADVADRETVFVLDSEKWTEFALPGQTELIRVTAFSSGGPDLELDEDRSFVIEFLTLQGSRQESDPSRYHLRSRRPEPEQTQTRRADHDKPLLRKRSFYVDPQDVNADRLWLRLPQDASVDWLAVQVHAKIGRDSEETNLLWSRLRATVRGELSRASIAPLNLLSREERSSLLRNGWQPLGPEGIAGKAYFAEFLYQKPALVDPTATFAGSESGTLLDPQHQLSVHIQEKTTLTLQASNTKAQLHWSLFDDHGLVLREQRILPVSGQLHWQGEIEPGLLVLSATEVVHLELLDQLEGRPMEFEFGYLPTYLIDQQTPIHYSLNSDPSAVLRVDLRGLSRADGLATDFDQAASFCWLDQNKLELECGELALDRTWSSFDRLSAIQSLDLVSERSRYFLIAPKGAASLQLSSGSPALIAVANRPQSLPWLRPSASLGQAEPSPAWFSLYPQDETTLIAADRRLLLRRQPQPETGGEHRNVDRYQWLALAPNQAHLAQLVVAPASNESTQADSTAFIDLKRGDNLLNFNPKEGSGLARLLYVRDNDLPIELHLRWSGGELRRQIAGQTGQVQLPVIAKGRQIIWLDASDGRYWINQTQTNDVYWRQRRVYALDKQPLEFVITKTGDGREVVNIEAYLQRSDNLPKLRATVRLPPRSGVVDEYTIATREFQLEEADILSQEGFLLYSAGTKVTRAQRGLFVLGTDIPPGQYRLDLAWATQASGYVAAYQLRRDVEVISRFFTDEAGQ